MSEIQNAQEPDDEPNINDEMVVSLVRVRSTRTHVECAILIQKLKFAYSINFAERPFAWSWRLTNPFIFCVYISVNENV